MVATGAAPRSGINSNPSHNTKRIGAAATLRLMRPSAHRSRAVDATVAASLENPWDLVARGSRRAFAGAFNVPVDNA